jgi:hypothetical protein
VSLRESLNTGPQNIGIYVPLDWDEMDEDDQYDWLARNVVPWFFTFYVSWMDAAVPRLMVWYDEYYKDEVAGVRKILKHTGLDKHGTVTDEAIRLATKPGDSSRLCFGKSGRGKQLPAHAIETAHDIAISWGGEWNPRIRRDLLEWK